jgi:hypothetical protein
MGFLSLSLFYRFFFILLADSCLNAPKRAGSCVCVERSYTPGTWVINTCQRHFGSTLMALSCGWFANGPGSWPHTFIFSPSELHYGGRIYVCSRYYIHASGTSQADERYQLNAINRLKCVSFLRFSSLFFSLHSVWPQMKRKCKHVVKCLKDSLSHSDTARTQSRRHWTRDALYNVFF